MNADEEDVEWRQRIGQSFHPFLRFLGLGVPGRATAAVGDRRAGHSR